MGQPKRVIFLDFDGVLNSMASFHMERRKTKAQRNDIPVNQMLCHVCCSNFQYILDKAPNTDIVISSTWRELFDLDWLKAKLSSYGIDTTRVIGMTPTVMRNFSTQIRGDEIKAWLNENPGYDRFVILDDNFIGNDYGDDVIVQTSWKTGLTLDEAVDAIYVLGGHSDGNDLPL